MGQSGTASDITPDQRIDAERYHNQYWRATTMEHEAGTNASTNEGETIAKRDYRDDLRDLLDKANDERGLTRYRLCKQMGIDSGTLSNVLAKRRHFSLDKLEQILGLLGYRLAFAEAPGGVPQA